MTHLRSPSVHHLDLKPWSLHESAGKRKSRQRGLFAPPYDRPALEFFNAHCDGVIERFGLDALHIKARVTACKVDCDSVRVECFDGTELSAEKVVLALGASEQPSWPDWAPQGTPRVYHVFDPAFDGWPSNPETVVVVGGGISAGQLALKLVAEGHRVHLVSRHALRQHQFDSDPGWLGPKFMTSFNKERDLDRRRRLITEARHRGSVPPDVYRALRRTIKDDRLDWRQDEVESVSPSSGGVTVDLASAPPIEANRILLATGFRSSRPGGELVDKLVSSASLSCAQCGYPIVDKELAWHPRIYVSGPLAELELGPTSRNIHGARRAGDRLVKAVKSQESMSAKVAS